MRNEEKAENAFKESLRDDLSVESDEYQNAMADVDQLALWIKQKLRVSLLLQFCILASLYIDGLSKVTKAIEKFSRVETIDGLAPRMTQLSSLSDFAKMSPTM